MSSRRRLATLSVAALGVVYGDIGTSPLYAVKETFFGHHPLERNEANVLGVLSLIFWSLLIVVTLKYVTFVLRADHRGEGGIWALLGILRTPTKQNARLSPRVWTAVTIAVLIGAALLYGDGIITPAISILSAYEGLETVTSTLKPAVIPATLATLFFLFLFQSRGTSKVGRAFGPIMAVWFSMLAVVGLPWIACRPTVLNAVHPGFAIDFLRSHGGASFFVLGSTVLCITGAEALYADLGHFGRRAVTVSWFSLVYPCLLINYFGQGARLLDPSPIANDQLFFAMFPAHRGVLIGAVVLSSAATVIASQALISGAFSLTRGAMALGFFPRVQVVFTSETMEGQIYLPLINWMLFVGCASLVLLFKTSSALAAAYGIAVTGTMAVTTVVFYLVIRSRNWKRRYAISLCALFLAVDIVYFFAGSLRFEQGGYVPVLIALCLFVVMRTWQYGRAVLARAYAAFMTVPLKYYIDLKQCVMESPALRKQYGKRVITQVERAVVFMGSRPAADVNDACPVGLRIYLKRNGAFPKHVILLNVTQTAEPYVADEQRFSILSFGANVVAVNACFGYMQPADVPKLLRELKSLGLIKINAAHWSVQVGEEEIILDETVGAIRRSLMKLFQIITHFTTPADRYFGLRQYAGRAKTVVPIIVGGSGARIVVTDEEIEEAEVRRDCVDSP